MKITLSVIKADIGSIGGHLQPSAQLVEEVRRKVAELGKNLLIDTYIGYTGDDIAILMTHTRGLLDEKVHKLAWDTFLAGTEVAKAQGLYGAGQDLLKDSFSGNVKGMGPAVAELEFEERANEAFLLFAADKTDPGAYNLPCSLAFAALWRDQERFVVESIRSRATGDIAVSVSTTRLHNIAGKYTGKDDPVMLVRVQGNFPATGEVLSPFTIGHFVAGFMRGSHHGALMPVAKNTGTSFFDGPPIVSCLAFCVKSGKLTEPADPFDHPYWEYG